MSTYKKYRSRKSIYHPGIALDHSLTYNQKKGMILQRNTSLPEPGHVYTRKELKKMYQILSNFHMIPRTIPSGGLRVSTVSVDLSESLAHTITLNSEWVIENSEISPGQPYFITIFSVDKAGNSPPSVLRYPYVNYTISNSAIGSVTVNCTMISNQTVNYCPSALEFGCPYKVPYEDHPESVDYPQQYYYEMNRMKTLVTRMKADWEGASGFDVIPWNDYLDQFTTTLHIGFCDDLSGWSLVLVISYLVNN